MKKNVYNQYEDYSNVMPDSILINYRHGPKNGICHSHTEEMKYQLSKQIISAINDRYWKMKQHAKDKNRNLCDLLYAFTFKYNFLYETNSYALLPEKLKNTIDIIHHHIVGPYNQRSFKKAMFAHFVDVSGSKTHRSLSELNNNPHHHGVMLLHPDTYEKWKRFQERGILNEVDFLQSFKIESCTDRLGGWTTR